MCFIPIFIRFVMFFRGIRHHKETHEPVSVGVGKTAAHNRHQHPKSQKTVIGKVI